MADSETAVYVAADGARARVRLDDGKEVSLRQVGTVRPVPGERVRITRDGGDVIVGGVIQSRETVGTVVAVGVTDDGFGNYIDVCKVTTPNGETHDGLRSLLPVAIGDPVLLHWSSVGAFVLGSFAAIASDPVGPGENQGSGVLTHLIPATWSGTFTTDGGFVAGDASASSTATAVWGGYNFAPLAGLTIVRIEIQLPGTRSSGPSPLIGTHPSTTPGVPTPTYLVPLTTRSGTALIRDDALQLNPGWGEQLESGGGITIPASAGTDDLWAGVTTSPTSGRLRIITRS